LTPARKGFVERKIENEKIQGRKGSTSPPNERKEGTGIKMEASPISTQAPIDSFK